MRYFRGNELHPESATLVPRSRGLQPAKVLLPISCEGVTGFSKGQCSSSSSRRKGGGGGGEGGGGGGDDDEEEDEEEKEEEQEDKEKMLEEEEC